MSVFVYFAVLGLVCTAWASSIDDLKVLLGLSAAEQGWLLLCGPLGNLVSFSFASTLLARIGARRALIGAGFAYLVSASAIGWSFHCRAPVVCWCVAIACMSGTGNIYNIAVNTVAGTVERRAGRTIMNSFHAVFSTLCFFGGIFALSANAAGMSVTFRFAVTLALAFAAHLFFMRRLPADDAAAAAGDRRWHRPDRSLLALGLAGLVVMGCEGAVGDWVGVFYREALGVDERYVKLGFCAVTGLMATGRFFADRFINRFGAGPVFKTDCVLVSAGLAIAMTSPYCPLGGLGTLATATAGFAVTGLGISGLVPILYSKANRTKAMPAASAVTFVGSMGFLGYFMGPPLIGQIAQSVNYSVAIGVFAVLILFCLPIDMDGRRS